MRCLDSIVDSTRCDLSKLREVMKDREAWQSAVRGGRRVRHDLVTEQRQQQRDKACYSFSLPFARSLVTSLGRNGSWDVLYSQGSVTVSCCLCCLFHVVIRGPVSLRLSLYICDMAPVILTLILESEV